MKKALKLLRCRGHLVVYAILLATTMTLAMALAGPSVFADTPQPVKSKKDRPAKSLKAQRDALSGVMLAQANVQMAPGLAAALPAQTGGGKKPNILIIWGDDIGWNNLSCYNRGMMGYKTPNIDRLAAEGALFTDWYGQQACTAGRAAFLTGQSPFRTGLLKVGLPGAKEGLSAKDPTLAELLKNHGYMTAQYGKNHLGDLDEHLPSNHGFDEFFGNLYHLNAEQEPEHPDYPKDPEFKKKFGPRGVIKSSSDGKIDATYLNPRPIHVSKAEAITKGGYVIVVVTLQDRGYPGNMYTLTYDPRADHLDGVYHHRGLGKQFDVEF